ncbi:hypothetical protein E3N88_22673 [Mikania micrantha]|uniref:C-JID domain-containing protein n=1 Tax=Mikania micrantha TaxID=192012 RepID=A0A5N6NB27_9ASTR|nr:hypothetical protein E3N88_22673 [Mikania micrantha]
MRFVDATMENNKIEAVKYDDHEDGIYTKSKSNNDASQLCKIVSNMKKLRYLEVRIRDPTNVEGPAFLSNELRYFSWHGYPAKSPFPDGFQPVKLVVLKLEQSFQKEVWKGWKHLPHLKVLQLCSMWKLLRTPNFNGLPRLQKLTLSYCPELKEIHQSFGNHTSLQYISVSYCKKLRMFPTIIHMKNLKNLEIVECPKILEFPKIHANMESLVELAIEGTGIEVLPSSIGEHCTNLISLKLQRLYNLKSINVNFDALKHLKELQLKELIQYVKPRRGLFHQSLRNLQKLGLYASLSNKVEIPSSIIELSNLQELDLGSNDFSRFGFSLSQLTQLKRLNVSHCKELLELPELPSSLTTLLAVGCKSLTSFGDCYKNCRWLGHVSLEEGNIINEGDRLLQSMLEACMSIENHDMVLYLRGIQIAKGFTHLLRGKRHTLQLPENWRDEFSGFLMCAVDSFNFGSRFFIIHVTKEGTDTDNEETHTDNQEMMDSEDVASWKHYDIANNSWMAYVSFDSLRQSTAWWHQTCKALTFESILACRGFGVRVTGVPMHLWVLEVFDSIATEYGSTIAPAKNFDEETDISEAIGPLSKPQLTMDSMSFNPTILLMLSTQHPIKNLFGTIV